MSWLSKLFPSKKTSANIAKERLQIIVAHQRANFQRPDFLSKLQQEITDLILKYVDIPQDDICVDFNQEGDRSVLELNITIPEPQKTATDLPLPSNQDKSAKTAMKNTD